MITEKSESKKFNEIVHTPLRNRTIELNKGNYSITKNKKKVLTEKSSCVNTLQKSIVDNTVRNKEE